jgi:hypothetical protein
MPLRRAYGWRAGTQYWHHRAVALRFLPWTYPRTGRPALRRSMSSHRGAAKAAGELLPRKSPRTSRSAATRSISSHGGAAKAAGELLPWKSPRAGRLASKRSISSHGGAARAAGELLPWKSPRTGRPASKRNISNHGDAPMAAGELVGDSRAPSGAAPASTWPRPSCTALRRYYCGGHAICPITCHSRECADRRGWVAGVRMDADAARTATAGSAAWGIRSPCSTLQYEDSAG